MDSLEAKVVVLGSQGVGKTSVVVRYIGKAFSRHLSPTIGASFFTCKLTIQGFHVKLQIWDTAGQERFRSMAPMYYRNANAALLVFDITSYESYLNMKTWVMELRRNVEEAVVMCVLGNKCDLKSNRAVNTTEAQQYAVSIGATYFETSAVSNEGIEEAFAQTALGLIEVFKNNESQHNKSNDSLDGVDNVLSPQYPLRTNVIKTSEPEGQRIFCC
ncbi:ras-related protein Rab-31-like isoform X1 [Limulus polyphemus]|uniref:Ras-related protein Rab-31-like isoform X1 n=1 Tax=Limulus polyphemus TaxID=6850 RepID=A0ABM1BNZ1_LIMPO|nr:ras-related protein Rab-31-like isoform X1 [Limulus polyphemus]